MNPPAIRIRPCCVPVARVLGSVWARDGALKTIEFRFVYEPLYADTISAGKTVQKIAMGWFLLVVLVIFRRW